ncbi:reverse transcriptase [Gossypium australe]|uniref:Reverse transcriptase n=1 Tax=Gossypium australe TaxID=47621 RepID=A0A5B6X027_9ROSI|nr:reverse transcriptase [Gossypium australe]
MAFQLYFRKVLAHSGEGFYDFCLEILNRGKLIELINRTNIVLIPKVDNPTSLRDFRPISLCMIFYKIITKTVANILQKILESCIDEAESAFMPGRLIIDNVFLRTGRKGYLALKLDMSKTYYQVEWPFIEKMMLKMGFERPWVEFIMGCVNSVSYSIIINGKTGEHFKPKKGLR